MSNRTTFFAGFLLAGLSLLPVSEAGGHLIQEVRLGDSVQALPSPMGMNDGFAEQAHPSVQLAQSGWPASPANLPIDPRVYELGIDEALLNSSLWLFHSGKLQVVEWGPFASWLSGVLRSIDQGALRQPVKRVEPRYLVDGDAPGIGLVSPHKTLVILFHVDGGDASPAWLGDDYEVNRLDTQGEVYDISRIMRAISAPGQ